PVPARNCDYEVPVHCGRGASRNDQTPFRGTGEVHDGLFNLTRIANSGWAYFHPDRLRCGLDRAKLAGSRRIKVSQYDHAREARLDGLEKPQPLCSHAEVELCKSGYVAAWTREACDVTGTHRVRHLCEHDRYAAGLLE